MKYMKYNPEIYWSIDLGAMGIWGTVWYLLPGHLFSLESCTWHIYWLAVLLSWEYLWNRLSGRRRWLRGEQPQKP